MQSLRRMYFISLQRECVLYRSRFHLTFIKGNSALYGPQYSVTTSGRHGVKCLSRNFLIRNLGISSHKQASHRSSFLIRQNSKRNLQTTNADKPSSNIRNILNLNSIGKQGKQGKEIQRLVDLAKPEWKKLGGL